MTGQKRMTMHFRPGEVEVDGVVDKVSYEQVGMDVVVTYATGALQGKSVRFTMTGPNNATSELGALSRRAR